MNTKSVVAVPKKPKVAKAVPKKPKVAKAVPKKPKVAKAVPKKPKVAKAVPKKPKVEKAVPKKPKVAKAVVKKPKKYNNINGGVVGFAFRTNRTNGTNNVPASPVLKKEKPPRDFFTFFRNNRTDGTNNAPASPVLNEEKPQRDFFPFYRRFPQKTYTVDPSERDLLLSNSSRGHPSKRRPFSISKISNINSTVFILIQLFRILTKKLIGDKGLLMKDHHNEFRLMKTDPLVFPLVLDDSILDLTINIIRKINDYYIYTNYYLGMRDDFLPDYFQKIPYLKIMDITESINTYNRIEDCIRSVLTNYKNISPDIHKEQCKNYKSITKRAYDYDYEC